MACFFTLPSPVRVGGWAASAAAPHPQEAVKNGISAPPANIRFGWPVACVLGQTCWVAHYVDQDPGPAVKDFALGDKSYNTHNGTDIALPHFRAMQQGVSVVAAAAGTVLRLRNTEPDTGVKQPGQTTHPPAGKECGNGLVIEHKDGWQTQYCHLKQGSIVVKPGQVVPEGAPLGQVGLSGNTEFPHLHLTVRHQGRVVDPFWPESPPSADLRTAARTGLWKPEVFGRQAVYQPVDIFQMGLAEQPPTVLQVRQGNVPALRHLSSKSGASTLVLWAEFFGLRTGDVLHWRIIRHREEDNVFQRSQTIQGHYARYFAYQGQKRQQQPLQPGRYQAVITVQRGKQLMAHQQRWFSVSP
ncbi:MAG: M23 family metallopeptidase [Candidatus Melainabacteria bacterium]|nr:M23 family metallopeptidase [Candidatus Melainabacteria bacterium]